MNIQFVTSIGRGDQFARLAQELNQTQLRLLFQFNTGFQALRALAQRLEILRVERSPTCHCFSRNQHFAVHAPGEFCPSTKLGVVSLPGSSGARQIILLLPIKCLKPSLGL